MEKINKLSEYVSILEVENIVLEGESLDILYQSILDTKTSFAVVKNEDSIYIVTKEKSVFKMTEDETDEFIENYLNDEYYKTVFIEREFNQHKFDSALKNYFSFLEKYKSDFDTKYAGYLFGVVASKIDDLSFIITIRGKKDLNDYSIVYDVNHDTMEVLVAGDKKPATNASLMAHIFNKNTDVKTIIMRHHIYNPDYETLEFYPSGTYRDSVRNINSSINIYNHGSLLLFDSNNNIIEKTKTK